MTVLVAVALIVAPHFEPIQETSQWEPAPTAAITPNVSFGPPIVYEPDQIWFAPTVPSVPLEPPPVPDIPPLEDTTPQSLSDAQLYRLRMCESTDRYWIATGNGYYGAYQFDLRTWRDSAARHLPWLIDVYPHHASPPEQDNMTRWLWSERGGQPWPVCRYRVGAA